MINFKIFDITVQWVEAHYNVVADVVENIRLLEVAGMDINQMPCVTIGVLLIAMVKLKNIL